MINPLIHDLNRELTSIRQDRSVILCDCTLREGEQAAGVAFGLETRLEIARLLSEIGVPQIQVGYPGLSTKDQKAAQAIKKEGLPAKIETISILHVDDWKRHIDAALECEADILGLQFGISALRLEKVMGMDRAAALDRMRKAVTYAKHRGDRALVSFTPTDATRTELSFLQEVLGVLVESGVDRIRIADSIGVFSPMAMRRLVAVVREIVGARPIAVHCHNDYGLALANTVAAFEAGADILDVTVNGLGERTGNTPLDEAAMVLTRLYGLDVGLDLGRLVEVAGRLEKATHRSLPPAKPVVGRDAFAHVLDTHILGMEKTSEMYEPFDPGLVGNRRRFPLSRLSGPAAVRRKLRVLGLMLDPVWIDPLVKQVRERAAVNRGEVSDDEFASLAEGFGARRMSSVGKDRQSEGERNQKTC